MGHYELAEFADVYTQLMFTDVRSIAQIAPGGAFFDTSTINCDNPFLSAQQRTTIGCVGTTGTGGAVHRSSQRRRRRSPAGLPQLLVPRPGRVARHVRGRLGLRRQHAVRAHDGGSANAELFRDRPTHARTRCGYRLERQHRVPFRWSDCVPYNPFSLGGVTNAVAEVPAGARSAAGHHRSERDDGRHHRRPRHDRRPSCRGRRSRSRSRSASKIAATSS